LKDGNGETYYESSPHVSGSFMGYTGILNCLKKLGEIGFVNIHSLNHDLFFERLNATEWLNGELCDGFEELGSPYYGKLQVEGRVYKVRLSRFIDKYNKKFRLYKLHGSRDYGVYSTTQKEIMIPEAYIKKRYGVKWIDIYKEMENTDGGLQYEQCWLNYHADFLTGTTSKILRYKERLFYRSLFEKFEQNLLQSERLVIVGYGCKDQEINRIIAEFFDFKNKPSFIIDPKPGTKVVQLAKLMNANIINKPLEYLEPSDIGL
jgi:hypothetical protein